MPNDRRVATFHALTSNRWTYAPYLTSRPHLRGNIPSERHRFVLEGFPRSGNSYAAVMLASVASCASDEIASHTHTPRSLIRGLKLALPSIALIRHPDQACASFVQGESGLKIDTAFKLYTKFYAHLVPYKSELFWLEFNELTNEWSAVVERLRARYNDAFDGTVLSTEDAFNHVDRRLPPSISAELRERQVSRPSPKRDKGLAGRMRGLADTRTRGEALCLYDRLKWEK